MKTKTNSRSLPQPELIETAKQFAYSLCRNRSDAEDLVQQAWMKLTAKYGEVANRSILYVSIRHLWFDQLRRSKIVEFSPIEGSPEPYMSEKPGYSLDMETALSELSGIERQSILLNVVDGYTAREISEKLKTPRGTILSHLCRARAKLRCIFGEEFGRPSLAMA